MATCPECDADIDVDEFDVDKGDQLSCPDCGSNLEVIGLSPIELDIAPEDDEDDDDEMDDDLEGDDDGFRCAWCGHARRKNCRLKISDRRFQNSD